MSNEILGQVYIDVKQENLSYAEEYAQRLDLLPFIDWSRNPVPPEDWQGSTEQWAKRSRQIIKALKNERPIDSTPDVEHVLKTLQVPRRDITLREHGWEVRTILRKSRNPAVRAWLDANPKRLPAALYDDGMNGIERTKKADKIISRLQDLETQAGSGGLIFVTVTGGGDNARDLYNGKGAKWAAAKAKALAGGLPCFWTVEYGPDTGIHVHIVISAQRTAAVQELAEKEDAAFEVVFDLYGLACYLSKPKDSRAACKSHARLPDVEAHAEAVRLYLVVKAARVKATGRMKSRLPDTYGFVVAQCVMVSSNSHPSSDLSSTASISPVLVSNPAHEVTPDRAGLPERSDGASDESVLLGHFQQVLDPEGENSPSKSRAA